MSPEKAALYFCLDFSGVSPRIGRSRPALLSTPEFALRMLLGEVADVLLTGQRVLPKKALALDYTFKFPSLNDSSLADVLK